MQVKVEFSKNPYYVFSSCMNAISFLIQLSNRRKHADQNVYSCMGANDSQHLTKEGKEKKLQKSGSQK
jgi:hypothetical protein